MLPATEQRIVGAQQRLQRSRAQIFALAHELRGEEPPGESSAGSGFPHSRIVRALTGGRGRMLLGAAALGMTLMRPRMIWQLLRSAPLLRPLIMRYLLPKVLRW